MNRQLVLAAGAAVLVTLVVVGLGQSNVSSNPLKFGNTGKVAVVQLNGPISPTQSTGLGSTSGITPSGIRDINERIRQTNPDAVVYEINSGGGSVVASKDVRREIEKMDVPTVCRFRDVSASGGYLIALGCDRIVADSATLTGSIGVRSSYFQYSGLLDKLGVKYVNISSGELKELGNPYQNISDREREVLQSKADRIHDEFLSMVQENRNLSQSQMEEIRTGEPFLGERAQSLGLVDRIGGRETAIETSEDFVGRNLSIQEIRTTPNFSLLSLFGASVSLPELFESDSGSPIRAEY